MQKANSLAKTIKFLKIGGENLRKKKKKGLNRKRKIEKEIQY